ncbi:MAG: 3-dehydroquinate synthase [Clostridia bacterium]|nr:3-dehydroquinate synthase [Clostridia bacterium]
MGPGRRLVAETPSGRHDVVVAYRALAHVGAELRALGGRPLALVVTSPGAARRAGPILARSLAEAGIRAGWLSLPDGEQAKTPAQVGRIYRAALRLGLDRSSWIVALGGGTVTDAAGFAAATFLRGVPLALCPTTLLAQVDAALGGKTGVDLPEGKNLVGAFYWPRVVVADLALLSGLPRRQVRSGLAEAAKHGLIAGGAYHDLVNEEGPRVARGRLPASERGSLGPTLVSLVAGSAEVKLGVVARDPFEAGPRRSLNLGHTVGHALESLTGYRVYTHGEAVALGLVAEGQLALRLGTGWSEACQADLRRELRSLGLARRPPDVAPEALLPWIGRDKKRVGGEVAWVLPERPGSVVERRGVPDAEVLAALREAWRG